VTTTQILSMTLGDPAKKYHYLRCLWFLGLGVKVPMIFIHRLKMQPSTNHSPRLQPILTSRVLHGNCPGIQEPLGLADYGEFSSHEDGEDQAEPGCQCGARHHRDRRGLSLVVLLLMFLVFN